MPSRLFHVRNFERFQHYHDRRPPWVKLYRDLWRDREFFRLPERCKLLWIGLLTLASLTNNAIPDDRDWMATELALTIREGDLNVLISAGYLEVEQNASMSLAERYQDATVEREEDLSLDLRGRDKNQKGEGDALAPDASDPLEPQDLMDAWNEQCQPVGLGEVKELSPARREKLRHRIREHPDPEWWSEVLSKICGSKFCLGMGAARNGNGKPWKASFDWMIENDTNALKAYEGKYANE